MLTRLRKSPAHLEAVERVRHWTRSRFRLADDAAILVSEVACQLPGCPPIETVVAFWSEDGERRQFKLFKPVAEVGEEDLPPSWMKDRLIAVCEFGCGCC
jgi:hypothetical protein